MRLLVEAIPDVGHGDEHLEGVVFVDLRLAGPDFSLELLHSLPAVGRESQLLLVTPQNAGLLQTGLGQHVVQVHNLGRGKTLSVSSIT